MIRIVTGTLGSGKSYFAVKEILQWVKEGHIVFTNIALKKTPPGPGEVRPLPDDNIENFHKHIKGGSRERPNKVVIDEGHLFWGAVDQLEKKNQNKDLMAFLTMSRRMKVDVDLVTQKDTLINKGFRDQATWEIRLKNLNDHPVLKWFPGFRDLTVVRFFDPNSGSSASPHRLYFMRRGPSVWDYFDTEEIIRATPIETEVVEGLAPVKKSKKGIFIIAGFAIALWWSLSRLPGGSHSKTPRNNAGPEVPLVTDPLTPLAGKGRGTGWGRAYLDAYAVHKTESGVRCGVVGFEINKYVTLATTTGYRTLRLGSQFYGRAIKCIFPGRGKGGVTLTFDSGPPLLLMPVSEFRAIEQEMKEDQEHAR